MVQRKCCWPAWATESIEIGHLDPEWLERGSREKEELRRLPAPFGVGQVEHIGSTSVPDLPAKPILDFMADIHSFARIDDISASLAQYVWHYVPPELDNRPWRDFSSK